MKNKVLAFLFCLAIQYSFSQSDLTLLIEDMLLLSGNFVQPAADGSVYQSSSSWYRSGKTNEKWQVDVAIMNNVLFIPQKRRTFQFNEAEYNILRLVSGEPIADIPTAIGGDTAIIIKGEAFGDSFDFQAFDGLGQDAVYHPYLQASVGLPKGFEFKVRYSPKIEIDNSNFEILGLGIQSNLNALFKSEDGDSERQFLDFSALISYSKFEVDFIFDPFELPGAVIDRTIIDANSWLVQLIASKQINRFELFYAMGYTNTTFNYELGGEQSLFLDALNQSLTTLDNGQVDLKFDFGFNYNFKKITLNNTFSFGKFANYNLGIYYTIN